MHTKLPVMLTSYKASNITHFITYPQRNPCVVSLCMLARLPKTQNGKLHQGNTWTNQHTDDIYECNVIPIYVGHSG